MCGDDPHPPAPSTATAAVLPAYAGMIPRRTSGIPTPRRCSRVCGDDPYDANVSYGDPFVLPAYAGMIP